MLWGSNQEPNDVKIDRRSNMNNNFKSIYGEIFSMIDKVRDDDSANIFLNKIKEMGTANPSFQDTEHQSLKGNSLLHIAVAFGRPLAVNILLDEGADINFKNDAGLKPIELAENFLKNTGTAPSWADWQPTQNDYKIIINKLKIKMNNYLENNINRLWQCPKCGGILEKNENTFQISGKLKDILGEAKCSFCGSSHSAKEVYNGTFDFAESDEFILKIAKDRENIKFDQTKMRWVYKGSIIKLKIDRNDFKSLSNISDKNKSKWWHFWK